MSKASAPSRSPRDIAVGRRAQAADDIKFLMGTAEGERLIGYLLDFCHVFHDSVADAAGVHFDGNRTFFNEGQRSVGNEIAALIINGPERFKAATLRRITDLAEGV